MADLRKTDAVYVTLHWEAIILLCENLQFGASHASSLYGVELGIGWVGSWVHKFTWQWVGLSWVSYLVGWVGSGLMKWTHGQLCVHQAATVQRLCRIRPILYGAETWTLTKSDDQKLEYFHMSGFTTDSCAKRVSNDPDSATKHL